MPRKPSYKELAQRVAELEQQLGLMISDWAPGKSTELFEKIPRHHTDAVLEETIRKSEERYRLVTERTSDLVSITTFSSEPRYIYINPSHEATLGYKPQDLIGECPFDFIHPEDLEKLIQLLGSYITAKANKTLVKSDRGPTERFSYRLRDSWGNWRYLETTGDLLDDEHILFISRDITKREKLEQFLREGEERYRNLVEDMPSFMCRFLPDGTLTFANKRYLEYFNRKAETLIGQNFFQFIPEQQRESVRQHFLSLDQHHPMITYEHQVLSPQGELRWQQWTDRAIFDDSGQVREYQSVGLDVTDEKEALAKLVESEAKYRFLVENANDAIFILSGDKIDFPNPKARAMGREMGFDLEKKPFYAYIHPEDRAVVQERHLRRLRGENLSSVYSFRLINDRGEERWVELNTSAIDWEGKPSTLNLLRDITVQKTLEAELQQARRMEALGTLAGGIAHDFNNLLMGIEGRVSMMLMNADATYPHYIDLKDIEDIIRSGAELTRQLLGISKGGRCEVKVTDLNDLIQQCSEMFRRTNRHIRIQKRFQKGLWAAEVDRGQIDQVLLNLFMNGSEAMPDGGTLSITTRNETLDKNFTESHGVSPGRFVHISVADTGVGMDDGTLRRIFEPFFTTKGMGRGRGLGLASAYAIVKNHGGIIAVSTKPGGGTTFDIYLPTSEKAVAAEIAPPAPEPLLGGTETVLIVDDEPKVLDICERFLKTLGYSILTARTGWEALQTYERHKANIDVVVLDMILPGMGGRALYEAFKAMEPGVRVLIATGYSVEGEVSDLIKQGCRGCIQKPFSMKLLASEIRRVLDES